MSTYLKWGGANLSADWQGIRYVTLVIIPPPTPADQTTARLTVHLNRPPNGMTAVSFSVSGGKRITDLSPSVVTPIAQDAEIHIARIGDHSVYTVTLNDGGNDPVHPFFATADFVFTVDCPAGDCRASVSQAEKVTQQPPAIDLLTKDYNGFLSLLGDRVRVSNPDWADLSPASQERVLLELLAHHADMLSYFQDRVGNESFIDDASQRYSLRQHGLLLGYQLFDGAAATTTIAFQVSSPAFLPAGSSFRNLIQDSETAVVFYLQDRTRALPEHNSLPVAAWPYAESATLGAGSSQVLLYGHDATLLIGQRLAFVQPPFSQVVTITQIDYLSLPGWTDSTSDPPTPLTRLADVTSVTFAPVLTEDLSPFDPTFTLYGNLGDAVHGEQRNAFLNPSNPDQLGRDAVEITLNNINSIVVTDVRGNQDVPLLRALRVPDGPVLFVTQSDGTTQPGLSVTVNGTQWYAVEHLHASQPFDTHYVPTADEDGFIWLQFGDGVQGAAIETSDEIQITYRIGNPAAGNIGLGTLSQVIPSTDAAAAAELFKITSLTNVVPGSGGLNPETKDAARLAIPTSLRHGDLQRAVAIDDYATAALAIPGVTRAVAFDQKGVFSTVLVLVDPEGEVDLTPELRAAVEAHLEQVRMAGREVVISTPNYVPLDVTLAVCPEPGAQAATVRETVLAALRPGTDNRPGFFHPNRLFFGEEIDLAQVLAVVQGLPGVRSVKALRFEMLGVPSLDATGNRVPLKRIKLSPPQIPRNDANEDIPENGRLEILMVGTDPEVSAADFAMLPEPVVQ